MIPTSHKQKLPKTMSYPLGAEAISDALLSAPNVDRFTIVFSALALWPASESNRRIREGLSYPILVVQYTPPLRGGFVVSKQYAHSSDIGHWSIRVNAVLRELRQPAGALLRELGLPAIVEWLRSSGRTGWETRQHSIELMFDAAAVTLSVVCDDGV